MPIDRTAEASLIENLRRRRSELHALLDKCSSHWEYEDPIYRFYHQSWKVYGVQGTTIEVVTVLQSLAPERPLNEWFTAIVAEGTGKTFDVSHNANWTATTRPIVEAFLHARFFLEMAVRYSTLEEPPMPLPSGYAALLYLYGLR